MKPDRIEVFKDEGQFRVRVITNNKPLFVSSQGYSNRANAVQMAKSFALRHDRHSFDVVVTNEINQDAKWTKPEKFQRGGARKWDV